MNCIKLSLLALLILTGCRDEIVKQERGVTSPPNPGDGIVTTQPVINPISNTPPTIIVNVTTGNIAVDNSNNNSNTATGGSNTNSNTATGGSGGTSSSISQGGSSSSSSDSTSQGGSSTATGGSSSSDSTSSVGTVSATTGSSTSSATGGSNTSSNSNTSTSTNTSSQTGTNGTNSGDSTNPTTGTTTTTTSSTTTTTSSTTTTTLPASSTTTTTTLPPSSSTTTATTLPAPTTTTTTLPGNPPGIIITSATYGLNSNICSAKTALINYCSGKAICLVTSGNQLCGDPLPTELKRLNVTYTCNGTSYTKTIDQYTSDSLTCWTGTGVASTGAADVCEVNPPVPVPPMFHADGWECKVYNLEHINPHPLKVPNFDVLTPVGVFTVNQFDIPATHYSQSFPKFPYELKKLKKWYGLRCSALIKIPKSAPYTFYLTSDDGSNLYIDNALVVGNDGQHSIMTKYFSAVLAEGTHPIRVDYFQGPSDQIALTLQWMSPDFALQIVPQSVIGGY